MNFSELRSKYKGFDDNEIISALQATKYPEFSVDEIKKALDYTPRPRGLFDVANDTVISAANTAASAVGSIANFVAPGNRASKFIDEKIIRPGEAAQTDAVKASRERFQSDVENASGIGGELAAVGRYVLDSPLQVAAQAAGSFVVPGLAVKGASLVAQAARATEAGAVLAGRAGGVAAGAALSGGDAAGTAYDLSIKAGATEAQAVAAARQASVLPAIVGGAGGAFGAEKLLAGGKGFAGGTVARALKTGASEAVQEGFEEGITQYEGQRAAMPFDSTINPMKGVAANAALGAVMGGATGAAASVLSHDAPSQKAIAVAQSNKAMDDLAASTDADAAVEAFGRTHMPLSVPKEFDAEGAMARMERANANNLAGMRDFSRTSSTASIAAPAAAAAPASPTAAVDAEIAAVNVSAGAATEPVQNSTVAPSLTAATATFQERLDVVRQQLDDTRVQQRIRDNSGANALNDALFMAKQADDVSQPGATSDAMLAHAERILDVSGVAPLKSQVVADAKARQAAEKLASTQARAAELLAETPVETPTAAPTVAPVASITPAQPTTEAPQTDANGYAKFDQAETLGVPRADMPQIAAENRGAMVNFLAARGITHEQEQDVDPGTLKPTQAEYSPEKVQKARDYVGGDRAILVSSDNRILDGHHQWLAKKEAGKPVRVIRLDAPIEKLIGEVRQMPSATADTGMADPLDAKPSLKERVEAMKARNAAPKAEGKPAESGNVSTNPQVIHRHEGKADIGPTVQYTTAKGKDLTGYRLRDVTDAEARAIDPYTMKMKDSDGYFIRERNQDALKEFERTRPAKVEAAPAPAPVAKPAPDLDGKGLAVPSALQVVTPEGDKGPAGTLKERADAIRERAAPANTNLTSFFTAKIQNGEMPKDNPALKKLVEIYDRQAPTPARMKEAHEILEAAIVGEARYVVKSGGSVRERFDKLLGLYESQPLLNARTSSSIENQAYSTPAPLALLGSELASITKQTTMLEPTGGTGMLTIAADPNKVIINEIDPLRRSLLKEQGFAKVTDIDATQRVTPLTVDRVYTNPPFGSLAEKVKIDGYTIGQIDHLIAARALESMKDDGAATLIIGANKVAGGASNQDLIFFNWLYGHYNVTSHFEVDGKLYARQGAGWPVRVITINGREKSARVSPAAGVVQRANNWEEVYGLYEQGLDSGRTGRGLPTAPVSATAPGPNDAQPVREPSGIKDSAADRREPAGSDSSDANVGGKRPKPLGNSGAEPTQPMGERDSAQRPSGSADRQDRLGGDAGQRGAGKPNGNSGNARVGQNAALTSAENAFQAAYVSRSSRKDADVLIPVNMQGPTQDALSRLEDAVGDIDEYARKELGYDSVEQLHDALMGLQVDSVASSIYQIGKGKGVVIADQTGIGKGRQAAAIIRWAIKNGRIPIFASVKPSLFTDMYGDLHDIGTDDVNPLILNSTEWIKGDGDAKLFANKPSQHRATLDRIANTGMLPDGTNALFMTYSQINVENVQRKVIEALAPRAVFIFDESHNAGGDSATGSFIKSSIDLARGVVYLSATYAKRPDNMPLYFKTDMGQAVADDTTLMGAMEAGGLPLQTVVSNNLVKAGQMFRRERSFDGVEIRTEVDTENRAQHEKQSDAATEALRGIVAADRMFHEVFFKSLKKQAAKEGAQLLDNAGNQAKSSVDRTQFSSVVHNFVRQMLLGLEAGKAADLAIAALQNGQKPIIALENTMGSFLNEYAEANSIKVGDDLGQFDYRSVLSRALERTRYYTKQLPNGDKVKVQVPMSQLDPLTINAYVKAQEVIDGLKLDVPVSPLDWMRNRLEKAGFSVAEITGRNLTVDYTDPKRPKLAQLAALEQKDKVRTTRQFNSGKLDAIILNVAGSTGISLHASEKFTDKRQRMMIVAQAAQDINIFMQMLGRIHRTGQVALPTYKLLNADLPAVKRPTALLAKKMKSLNANTSSNTESATSVQAFDMLNKYGDQVVDAYLTDNPTLAAELGLDAAEAIADGAQVEGSVDIARKMTGRLALLPVATQKIVYAELEAQYALQIDYLNKTNQNDLEPRTADFDAREMKSAVLFEGKNPESPFGQDAIYNEFSIKAQGIPPTPAEVQVAMVEHLAGAKDGDLHVREMIRQLSALLPSFVESVPEALQQKAKDTARGTTQFMLQHPIGSAWRVEINGEPYAAVVTNIKSTHKTTGNPFSMSKVQVTLALNGALRGVTVPATRFSQIETSKVGRYSLDSLFKEGPKDERQTVKIITGNLLAAYGELVGVRGTIVSFTKEDGTIEQGILLPKAFEMEKNTAGDFRLPSGEAALFYLQRSTNENIGKFGIQTRDGIVRVTPNGLGVRIAVPKSKAKGGKYFLDPALRAAVGGDFVSSGNNMVADVEKLDAPAALDVLMKKQALYTLSSMASEARDILSSLKPGTQALDRITNPDRAGQALVNTDSKIMQRADSAAEWLAGNATEPWVRELASKMQPFLDRETPVTYFKAGDERSLPSHVRDTFSRGGFFGLSEIDPVSGRGALYMRSTDTTPTGQEDLLHELSHVATQRAFSVTKSAAIRAELESIRSVLMKTFDQVISSPRANEKARNDAEFFQRTMNDVHELIAYGTASKTFRQWAQSLDATGRILKTPVLDQGAAPQMTLWQKFVDVLRSLVGLSKMFEPRLKALMERREAERLAFRTANTPETLARRLDTLLQQTMELGVSAKDIVEEGAPQTRTQQAGAIDLVRTIRNIDQKEARNLFLDAITSHSSTNVWQRTVGTQYAKAKSNPTTFGRVFDAIQDYIKDTSTFANAAADRAPSILPKLDNLIDLKRKETPKADIDAAGKALFEGTLKWSRDENGRLVDNDDAVEKASALTSEQKARVLFKAGLVTEAELKRWKATPLDIYDGAVRNRYEQKLLRPGVLFSDAELKSLFGLNEKQIGLYREFRAAVDQSLDDLGRTELVRLAGKAGDAVADQALAADSMMEAAEILSAHIDDLTLGQASAARRDELTELRNSINDKANQVARLKSEGYAPLMRFGEHTVDVVGKDGERIYFGMFESGMAANKAAREFRDQYPDAAVKQNKIGKEEYKLFQGLDLNALELFAESTGNADNAVYQEFLRLTKNNRSAMKRMIERKGVAGFNENTARVLASFVTSNARMASGNLHMGVAVKAAKEMPKSDLQDEAINLIKYVQNPGEEAAGVRALLFTQFIGGSIASAMVNLTQPFTMSLPYLSQYGGVAKAGKRLLEASKAAARGVTGNDELKAALGRAEKDGIVSPQEIHHLQSAAQDRLVDHPMLKKAAFIWGSMFSLSEQFNRRVTFIAAYQTAKEQQIADPFAFAEAAVIETQGLYNKGNKSNLSRGAIGATVMTFKQFSIHYLEFLNRMWKKPGLEGKKAVGVALAIMVLTAGMGGLPFADDLDDLIDTLAQALGYDFSSKKAKRDFITAQLSETAAEFLTKGASGVAGFPIDVSLRMGMGNLLPGTGALLRSNTDRSRDILEFAGAAGSLAKSAMDAGELLLKGDVTKAGMTMAPLAIQNMAKAAQMMDTGEYRNQKGQKVINVGPGDAVAKFIGFNPGDVARESQKQQEANRSIQLAKNVESEIAAKWAQGIADNRPELVIEALADLADWNEKNGNTMKVTMHQIISRVRGMRLSRAERTTKAAPREMRAYVRETLQ